MVTNCDNAIGAAICRELLQGHYRNHFNTIKATVHCIEQSADLWTMGASVMQAGEKINEDDMARHMQHVDGLVLVPACGQRHMVQQAQTMLRAAKRANINNCVVISVVGADETCAIPFQLYIWI